MKEIKDIVQAYDLAHQKGLRAALATVVHVEGSSYRRPGARMLVTEDGRLTGAISGGCLEGDALHKALFAIQQQQNKLVIYDTTGEDDLRFGVQLGCNGIVDILFEPIDSRQPHNPIQLLRELIRDRRDAVLVTLFSSDRTSTGEHPGTSLLYTGDSIQTSLPEEGFVLADVRKAFQDKASDFKQYPLFNGFVEYLSTPPALVIAGAGNDVMPLVEITSLLGWHTTVVDGRPHHATRERFSKADEVLVAKPQEVLTRLRTDEHTLFVLMTHNYNYDIALLRELLQKDYSYIGVLGPRKKLDRMIEELLQTGLTLDEQQLSTLHGPVGLDIGAETAQEIAVSIVAEIKAILSHRTGNMLKNKIYPIHA
ncbi:MAG: alanine dehydrogenase [Sphingobacteriales bacterium 50-39]|nr:XdhC family protein [Sphingobacteriales bacterium]OJW54295.1 MAG: alanine dehydrogenase [Sphingobacteriales bacterium 50-39]